MAKTVIGLMENLAEAQAVVRELVDNGTPRDDIGFMANEKHAVPSTAALNESEGSHSAGAMAGAGIGALTGGLIGGLANLGVPEEEARYYADAVRRGGIIVTVAVDKAAQAATVVAIMKRHGAVDIDQRDSEWKKQEWKGRFEASVYPKTATRRPAKKAAARPVYDGPERRVNGTPWLGEDRRKAA